jgi:hypothetical protein
MVAVRRTALAMIAALALIMVAGCGGDTPPAEPTQTIPASATVEVPTGAAGVPLAACDLLSLEAVSEFLGQPAQVDELSTNSCVWLADPQGSRQVHLQVYGRYSYFSPTTWGGTPEPIEGIGEEAYLIRQAVVGTVAASWDGEHAVFLSYTVLDGGRSEDRAEALVELLRTIVDR